jgi:hypothetical protein
MPYLITKLLDEEPVYERVESFHGGMDGFTRPTQIAANQCALLTNCILADNGTVKTRPGADDLGLAAVGGAYAVRGLGYFDTQSAEQLVAVVNGAGYQYGGSSWSAIASITGLDASSPVSVVQGNQKLYLLNGTNNWLEYDGTTATDMGDTVAGPPRTAAGAIWHAGRMWAWAGDALYYSDLGNASSGAWDQNNRFLRPGRGEGERIMACAGLQNFWVAVFKEQSIHLIHANPALTTLADADISYLGKGPGAVGAHAVAVSGGDAFFLARDGVRSVRQLATAEDQYEIAPPISQPLQPYIDRINWAYASTSRAVAYRHYVLFAVPLDSATSPSHVLAYNVRLRSWCGVWTGWTPTMFAVSRFSNQQNLVFGDESGRANEWKDDDDTGLDTTFTDNGADIATTIRTRSFICGEPVSNKDGFFFESRFINTATTVTISAVYDEADTRTWSSNLGTIQNQLPVNLPFDLAVTGAKTVKAPLNLVGVFNEAYFEITARSGQVELKNCTLSAWVNTVENE